MSELSDELNEVLPPSFDDLQTLLDRLVDPSCMLMEWSEQHAIEPRKRRVRSALFARSQEGADFPEIFANAVRAAEAASYQQEEFDRSRITARLRGPAGELEIGAHNPLRHFSAIRRGTHAYAHLLITVADNAADDPAQRLEQSSLREFTEPLFVTGMRTTL